MRFDLILATLAWLDLSHAKIDRQNIVSQYNPIRTFSSNSTPLQVGNGDFAFGVDVTGLQTFNPFATLSSWGWHNFSLPVVTGQSSIADFNGLNWWTHGRLVNYNQPNPAIPLISNWLIQNPQRINLGRVGFSFGEASGSILESNLTGKTQTLDLYTGTITSTFKVYGSKVTVKTIADPDSDTVSLQIESDLIAAAKLGLFFDYPYSDVLKFDYPFVGVWNNASLHSTSMQQGGKSWARIQHDIGTTTYYTHVNWTGQALINGPLPNSHRYLLQQNTLGTSTWDITINFSPSPLAPLSKDSKSIVQSSKRWWESYWKTGAFISLPSSIPAAKELQRRIITSQYLLAVNCAGKDPPQESGLVNNGWYGKFHMEMVVWHLGHWVRWGKSSLMSRSIPGVYQRFLSSSLARARDQGYKGAKWGKMSDSTGRSAPGEINSLLIWQQVHPMYFAEMLYREGTSRSTLMRWDEILTRTAEYMVSYAWWNSSTGVFDLGPPMYPVSENTNPNSTINPAFELAYWRFGLGVASLWKTRQGLPVPEAWTHVLKNLAPLPVINGTYPIYEGLDSMWKDPVTVTDHPAMLGISGLLPPSRHVNLTILADTAKRVGEVWNFKNLFGWDFPMLAMNAVRLGWRQKAVDYLLDQNFAFDDAGYPIGGPRVPTPYFPGSGGLLLAIAMIEGGWEGDEGGKWPEGWRVESEGFGVGM
ncbi:Six-hairpin glycosidase-like protein [Amylocarpus encephaloides]|uniref:Six-hairpin glycosidase-like protein n=1 Tax=Amylocarpus encephaloides TaxID=45428 RepID=A0A9P7YRY3_9HELO|nr:Six-hairpin glycosidase-like protein [Amylocarpus encephaloides]